MSGPHVGTRNADVGGQCLGSMGSCVDARIEGAETDRRRRRSEAGVRPVMPGSITTNEEVVASIRILLAKSQISIRGFE
jgi:hypothetical protein